MKKQFVMILAIFISLISATCFAKQKPVKIFFAASGVPGSVSSTLYEWWMDEVTKRSDGAIKFRYFSRGALGHDRQTLQQVIDGTIGATVVGIGPLTSYCDLPEAIQLPFLIDSYEKEWKVIQSKEWRDLLDGVEEKIGSIYILGTGDVGLRHFAVRKSPINRMEDLRGIKIRAASTHLIMDAMQLIGANPVNIPYTEIYTALQSGVVDGEEINFATVAIQKHFEIVKYMSTIGMYPYIIHVVLNKQVADSLAPEYLSMMKKVMRESEERYFTKTIVNADEKYAKICLNNGMKINAIQDPENFRDACEPLYSKYAKKDPRIKAFLKMAKALK